MKKTRTLHRERLLPQQARRVQSRREQEIVNLSRMFADIVETLLDGVNCGDVLLPNYHMLNNAIPRIDNNSINTIVGDDTNCISNKFDTIIFISPMIFMAELRREISYLDNMLNSLKNNGRIIFAIKDSFLLAPNSSKFRQDILEKFNIRSIVQLNNKTSSNHCIYILYIENIKPSNYVRFYPCYDSFYNLIASIKDGNGGFDVNIDQMDKRWDLRYNNPKYDKIRELFLSKDTVKIEDIADIIKGHFIPEQERRKTGEYLILYPSFVENNKINYEIIRNENNRLLYSDFHNDRYFKRSILRDGDILVCTIGIEKEFQFVIYRETSQKMIASDNFCIIRTTEENRKYIQLYFTTKTGKESFELQADMLKTGTRIFHLSPRYLSKFVLPDIESLQIAFQIQKRDDTLGKLQEIFKIGGWIVRQDYMINNSKFDIALFDSNNRFVGVIDTKIAKDIEPSMMVDTKKIIDNLIYQNNIKVFFIYIAERIYKYECGCFVELNTIPTPDDYSKISYTEILYTDSHENTEFKNKIYNISTDHLYFSMLKDIYKQMQANNEQLTSIRTVVEDIHAMMKKISNDIKNLQDLVEMQLNNAGSSEEEERILQSFVDICSQKIVSDMKFENEKEAFDLEKKKIILSIGEDAWKKMTNDSKAFLISAKIMFNKLITLEDIVDYSGVCILVMKALELEISERFYKGYVDYCRKNYQQISDAPKTVVIYNRYRNQNEFELGSFQYIVAKKFDEKLSEEDRNNILQSIIKYARECLLRTYLKKNQYPRTSRNDEVKKLLHDYAEHVETARKDYRNPAAHTGALTRVRAKACFDFVLDVKKLLKEMLDSFDF